MMERFLLGITLSSDISVISPKPWQVGQAPNGELKENMRGSKAFEDDFGVVWAGSEGAVHGFVFEAFKLLLLFRLSFLFGVDDYHCSFADLKRLLHRFADAAAFLIDNCHRVDDGFNPVFLVPHKLDFFFDVV